MVDYNTLSLVLTGIGLILAITTYTVTLRNTGKARQRELIFQRLDRSDCHGYNGKIPDLARDLRKELRATRYDKFTDFISKYSFGKELANYEECYKVLGAMEKFRLEKAAGQVGAPHFVRYGNVHKRQVLMDVGSVQITRPVKNFSSLGWFMEMLILKT